MSPLVSLNNSDTTFLVRNQDSITNCVEFLFYIVIKTTRKPYSGNWIYNQLFLSHDLERYVFTMKPHFLFVFITCKILMEVPSTSWDCLASRKEKCSLEIT